MNHPAESSRISKLVLKSSVETSKIAFQYTANTVFKPNPDSVILNLPQA